MTSEQKPFCGMPTTLLAIAKSRFTATRAAEILTQIEGQYQRETAFQQGHGDSQIVLAQSSEWDAGGGAEGM
jgi:hypothetical protein